nr:hypothetical protein Iba_chr13eCG9360 [Ipomoea batatas]
MGREDFEGKMSDKEEKYKAKEVYGKKSDLSDEAAYSRLDGIGHNPFRTLVSLSSIFDPSEAEAEAVAPEEDSACPLSSIESILTQPLGSTITMLETLVKVEGDDVLSVEGGGQRSPPPHPRRKEPSASPKEICHFPENRTTPPPRLSCMRCKSESKLRIDDYLRRI